jgi:hypothetical protein
MLPATGRLPLPLSLALCAGAAVPLTSSSSDFCGGGRKGANLFADSVAALDCYSAVAGSPRGSASSTSRILWASTAGVNGFRRNAKPGSPIPASTSSV